MEKTSNYPKLETMKIADIFLDESNPRKVDDKKLDVLRKSIAEYGNLQPIVVNHRTNQLISGHQRLKIISETQDEVEVWMIDVDEFSEKAASIALNNEVATFDDEALADILSEIDEEKYELTGFDEAEISRITTELDESFMEGTEELSEQIDIYKTTLEFSSLENKFKWEAFIDKCKLHAEHGRPVTDYMFKLIDKINII